MRFSRMIPVSGLAALVAAAVAFFPAAAPCAPEFLFLGSILEGPYAPTALAVTRDQIATLEPFLGQIDLYGPGGVITQRFPVSDQARDLEVLDTDRLVFIDPGNGTVLGVDRRDGRVSPFFGGAVRPVGLAAADGVLYVLDGAGPVIHVVDGVGRAQEVITLATPADGGFGGLGGLARNPVTGGFFLLDRTGVRILACDPQGNFLGAFCSFGTGFGQVSRAGEIACDREGWVYISDRYQGTVTVFGPDLLPAGVLRPETTDEGVLDLPAGMAIDDTGILHVASTEGAGILMYQVDKSGAGAPDLRARALSAEPGDDGGTWLLSATIDVPAAAQDPAADFELVAMPDSLTVLARADGVALVDPVIIDDRLVGRASWLPILDPEPATVYGWRCRARAGDEAGPWTALARIAAGVPAAVFDLEQNTPNPFNPRTSIAYRLLGDGAARLTIFDLKGRVVRTWDLGAGRAGPGLVVWDGQDGSGRTVSSGVYFYRLREAGRAMTRKMVLMK